MKKYLSILIAAAAIIFASCGGTPGETGSVVFKINPAALLASSRTLNNSSRSLDGKTPVFIPSDYRNTSINACYVAKEEAPESSDILDAASSVAFVFLSDNTFLLTSCAVINGTLVYSLTGLSGKYTVSSESTYIDYKNCEISVTPDYTSAIGISEEFETGNYGSISDKFSCKITVKNGVLEFSEGTVMGASIELNEDENFTYCDPNSYTVYYGQGTITYNPDEKEQNNDIVNTEQILFTIALNGDYYAAKTKTLTDMLSDADYSKDNMPYKVEFKDIPVGASVYAELVLYQRQAFSSNDSNGTENAFRIISYGISNRKEISAGTNTIKLSLKSFSSCDLCIYSDENDLLDFEFVVESEQNDDLPVEPGEKPIWEPIDDQINVTPAKGSYIILDKNESLVSYGTYELTLNNGEPSQLKLTEKICISQDGDKYSFIRKPDSQAIDFEKNNLSFKSASGKTYTFAGSEQPPEEPSTTVGFTVELGTFNDTDFAEYVTLSDAESNSDMVCITATTSDPSITIKNWTVMLGDKKIVGTSHGNTYTIPTGNLSTGIYNVTLTVEIENELYSASTTFTVEEEA